LGFSLSTGAEFPMEFYVEEIKSVVGAKVNPKATYKSRNVVVPVGSTGFYWDDGVPLTPDDLTNPLIATLSFRLKYGRPGALNYEMRHNFEIVVGVTEEKTIGSVRWSEVLAES
ncbi:MAG: hypothetical protein Q8K93_09215, partial [Reyranella sp.]|nr:hypothetical protein [Reyranella sp.]